jgi:hypothetical protein
MKKWMKFLNFLKKLLIYGYHELLLGWLFLFLEFFPVTIFFIPFMVLGFFIELPSGIRRVNKAIKKNIWDVENRQLNWHWFKV